MPKKNKAQRQAGLRIVAEPQTPEVAEEAEGTESTEDVIERIQKEFGITFRKDPIAAMERERESREKYMKSEKGMAARTKYQNSEGGKAARLKYQNSPKAKARQKAYSKGYYEKQRAVRAAIKELVARHPELLLKEEESAE